jgi:hypothetical protein
LLEAEGAFHRNSNFLFAADDTDYFLDGGQPGIGGLLHERDVRRRLEGGTRKCLRTVHDLVKTTVSRHLSARDGNSSRSGGEDPGIL